MALIDRVLSIISIPDKNTNDSTGNSTDLYEEWARGDGQLLLPLMLIMIFLFCSICALIQISIFVIFLCIRQLIGDNDVVEEAFSERIQSSRRDPSERSEKLAARRYVFQMGTDAESSTPLGGDGTPRSRKSQLSSPATGTQSV
ncbi:hypothetical protein GCK72_000157 [Caenorhabditis remanei]|uniref:Uncharacterized protein n=1 Tax=Caenorhabditis remanei TaxID=31234 RepID=A0A6A5HLC3_CAERE|nr:hypothetical protein GCK72_000157 [Caenorhabditis remanei]KAF1768345.1 hypothetical protein GCK72_000157 [Caenorhabditis remanei]